MSTRPSYPIGWDIGNGVLIANFIEKRLFTEVFHLSNGEFLYLFHDSEVQQKLASRKIEHENFEVGAGSLPGKRYQDHSEELLKQRLHQILTATGLDAIAGMNDLKALLVRDVIHPFTHRDTYALYKLNIPNGILFFGPPGCGKTYIARRTAEAMGVPIIEIRESDIGSSFVHGTTSNIARVFNEVAQRSPCVLFLDEISGFLPRRDSIIATNQYKESEINEFLIHLEGAGARDILVIGATNYPERIDTAILRSGRMDKRILIPPPDFDARLELLKMTIDGRPLAEGIALEKIALATDGYVSSDIRLLVDNAARRALQANEPISMVHLEYESQNMEPSVSKSELKRFLDFAHIQRV